MYPYRYVQSVRSERYRCPVRVKAHFVPASRSRSQSRNERVVRAAWTRQHHRPEGRREFAGGPHAWRWL